MRQITLCLLVYSADITVICFHKHLTPPIPALMTNRFLTCISGNPALCIQVDSGLIRAAIQMVIYLAADPESGFQGLWDGMLVGM